MKQLALNTELESAVDQEHWFEERQETTDSNVVTHSAPARANVTEIIISEGMADTIQMILPMLTQLNQEERWLAWIDPPIELLKQWKTQLYMGEHPSLNTDQIMVLRSDDKHAALDLTQRALKTGTCHAAIVWTKGLNHEEFNVLERASMQGKSHGIVLRYR